MNSLWIILGLVIFFLADCGIMLFFLGYVGVLNKTEEEKIMEDIEQIEYLKKWRKEHNKNRIKG